MVFCDNCGHKLRSTAKFCVSCGTAREPTEDTPKTRRSKPVQPRKKSREEELAEYEEEYLRAELNLQPKSKNTKSKPKSGSKRDSNDDTARYRRSMERPMGWKSESTTLLLAILPGLICIFGVGHLYLGMIGRGVVILIAGFVLLIVGIATAAFGIGIIILILAIPLFIWQIIDSRKLCRQYNDYYEEYGKEPNW